MTAERTFSIGRQWNGQRDGDKKVDTGQVYENLEMPLTVKISPSDDDFQFVSYVSAEK
jgi:hypothetical protein